MMYGNLHELNARIRGAIEALVADELDNENMATYVDTVRAAAYTDSVTGQVTAESLRAAVGSLIVAESLTPRDGLLVSILSRLEALENEVL